MHFNSLNEIISTAFVSNDREKEKPLHFKNFHLNVLKETKFKKIGNIKKIKVETLVVKKLPEVRKGKNSKKIRRKKTIDVNLLLIFFSLL